MYVRKTRQGSYATTNKNQARARLRRKMGWWADDGDGDGPFASGSEDILDDDIIANLRFLIQALASPSAPLS